MAASEDHSSTFSNEATASFVTTVTDVTSAPTFTADGDAESHPVASTLEEICPSPAGPDPALDSILGLRFRDCFALFVLAAVCLALSIWHWGQLSGWATSEVEIDRLPERVYDYRIDINEAGYVEWLQLPGIGGTLANRIVRYREEHGPFQSIDDLDNIKGIGPKTLEKLRPWLTVGKPAGDTGQE